MYNFNVCLASFFFTENLDIKGIKINAAGIPYAAAAHYCNAAENQWCVWLNKISSNNVLSNSDITIYDFMNIVCVQGCRYNNHTSI